mmetsp:Transcript_137153/g.249350  ORF Transcript_137153/g.249350 Transcript_137153/m.249350 type:complete len:292 (+) Transcript_137153:72-947(+)
MLAKLVLIACMCLSAESLHLRSQPSSSHSRRGRNLALTDKTRYVPGSDGTYAQNYQDVWAAALAKHNGWDNGFFLDAGAYHGTECSNSALLEKELGWTGICVEPEPVGFENRSCVMVARPLSHEEDKPIMFYGQGQIKHIGFRSWEDSPADKGTEINTITVAEIFRCLKMAQQEDYSQQKSEDCTRITGDIEIPSFINFVSLDVEGQESNVLSTFPWDEYKVGAWIVEQTVDQSRSAATCEESRQILRAHGYMQAPVENPGVDEYWVLPEYWSDELRKHELRIHPAGSNGC